MYLFKCEKITALILANKKNKISKNLCRLTTKKNILNRVEVLTLCCDRLDQKSVCFDSLGQNSVCFDRARPRQMCSTVLERPKQDFCRPCSTEFGYNSGSAFKQHKLSEFKRYKLCFSGNNL